MVDNKIREFSLANKLPLWWQEDLLVRIIDEYTGDIEFKYIYDLISNKIEQPVQVWKEALVEDNKIIEKTSNTINQTINLPITKYPTTGKIIIEIEKGHPDNYLKDLIIKNGTQKIVYENPKIKANKIIYDLNTEALYIDNQLTKFNTTEKTKQIIENKWYVYNTKIQDYEDTGFEKELGEPYLKDKTWFINNNTKIPAIRQAENPYIEEETWYVYDVIKEDFVDSNYEQSNRKPYIENDYWYAYSNEEGTYKNTYILGIVRNDPYIKDGYWYVYDNEEKEYKNTYNTEYLSKPYIKDGYWYVTTNLNIEGSSLINKFEDDYNEESTTLYKNKIELEILSTEEIISSFNNTYNITVEMENPVFTVEQNVKLDTLTFLPLKSIQLYGLYDFKHNPAENGWKSLWKKSYARKDVVVYDRLTKKFPIEKFYAEVELWGLKNPIQIGFPQEKETDDEKFLINPNLDRFGKIYGLPRREYKEEINYKEEIKTFPVHYPYNIEQDYWYERRLLSEYVYNEDKINSAFLKDNDDTSLIRIQSTTPFVEELVITTETNEPNYDIYFTEKEEYPNLVVQKDNKENTNWKYLDNIMNDSDNFTNTIIKNKQGNNVTNEKYKSKEITMFFDLKTLPENIKIEGIEILLDVIADNGYANKKDDERTVLLLPYEDEIKKIPCQQPNIIGTRRETLKFGGKKSLFNQQRITRDQLINDDFGFRFGITNNDLSLNSTITIFNAKIKVYYKKLLPLLLLSADINPRIINKGEVSNLNISVTNIGDVPVKDKEINLISSNQLELDESKIKIENLKPDESFYKEINIIGKEIGFWSIMTFLDGKVSTNNLMVK